MIDEFDNIRALGKQVHSVVFLDGPQTFFVFANFLWYFLDRNFYACELIETQYNRMTLPFVNSLHDLVLVKLVLEALRPEVCLKDHGSVLLALKVDHTEVLRSQRHFEGVPA